MLESASASSRAQLPLAQPQEELFAGRLVDRIRRRARVELGEQRHEIGLGLSASTRWARSRRCSSLSKCSGLDLREDRRQARRCARHAASASRSRLSSASISLGEATARRPRRACGPELIVRSRDGRSRAARRPAAPATRGAVQEVLDAQIRVCRSRARSISSRRDGPGTTRLGETLLETAPGSSAGSFPLGSATTRTSKPWPPRAPCRAASPPRRLRRRRSRGRAALSAAQLPKLALGQRRAHRRDDRQKPACRSAITSVFPSTTIARSSFVIAGRARWSP